MKRFKYDYIDVEISHFYDRGIPMSKEERHHTAIMQAKEEMSTWAVPAAWYVVREERFHHEAWRIRVCRKTNNVTTHGNGRNRRASNDVVHSKGTKRILQSS